MSSLYKLKEGLKESKTVTYCYETIKSWFRKFLYAISPTLLVRYLYATLQGRWLNLKNPKTFDEKLIWLMLFWQHPLKSQCADKYGMRQYVTEHGLGHILPEILGVYDRSLDINFNDLPDRFALKCTHGCRFNIICKDKKSLDVEKTKRKLNKWMKTDISKIAGEIHYALIEPRIICERYIDDIASDVPIDYKVYCFNGKAYCTLACTGRGIDGHAKFDLYDREWKNKLPYSKSSLLANRSIEKPQAYEEIINAAERLSTPFPFVRIDFYSINGRAIIGEITFTPNGCIDKGYTDVAQYELGKLLKLPEKKLI